MDSSYSDTNRNWSRREWLAAVAVVGTRAACIDQTGEYPASIVRRENRDCFVLPDADAMSEFILSHGAHCLQRREIADVRCSVLVSVAIKSMMFEFCARYCLITEDYDVEFAESATIKLPDAVNRRKDFFHQLSGRLANMKLPQSETSLAVAITASRLFDQIAIRAAESDHVHSDRTSPWHWVWLNSSGQHRCVDNKYSFVSAAGSAWTFDAQSCAGILDRLFGRHSLRRSVMAGEPALSVPGGTRRYVITGTNLQL